MISVVKRSLCSSSQCWHDGIAKEQLCHIKSWAQTHTPHTHIKLWPH